VHPETIDNVINHLKVMNEIETTPEIEPTAEVQPLLRRDIAAAAIASLVSLIFFYWFTRPMVSQLQDWWRELLAYAVLPVAVAFVILYRSGWHREITGLARTCSLLLVSCAILMGDLIAVVAVRCVAVMFISLIAFCMMGLSGGNH
jgi:hypothetical protein